MKYTYQLLVIIAAAVVLNACGGSSTGATNAPVATTGANNITVFTPMESYTGTDPEADDIQAFMVHFWNNVATDDRCGQCHDDSHQAPFARSNDINAAYNATLPFINRAAPQTSALVTKVEGGHQCWESNTNACAQILTRWIQKWVNDGNGTGIASTTIVLEKPDVVSIESAKVLPAAAPTIDSDPDLYSSFTDLYDTLTEHCSDCHSETASASQQPFFASPNEDAAWDAVRNKIDLNDENRTLLGAQSRLVVRLRSESHNCWSSICSNDAQKLLTSIQAMAADIELPSIDPDLKTSAAMILTEGTVASSGGRHEQHQIAYWNFSEGEGNTAFDTSGVEPAMHLSVDSGVQWVGGWGIDLGTSGGRAWADIASSKKLYDSLAFTGEYSVEAWVAPANVTQEEAHIISYAENGEDHNFVIGQTLYNYDFYQTTTIDSDGNNALSTDSNDEDLQAVLQHVVLTYDRTHGRRIYVNGEFTGDNDSVASGFLTDWNDQYVFSIGSAPGGTNEWSGMVRMAAIHSRALTADQVHQNYDVGVGQKYYLLFDISEWDGIDDCWNSYVVFEASQLDNYAYRFNSPFFARLYEPATSGTAPAKCTAATAPAQSDYSFGISDIRIGMNGKVLEVGQGFRTIGKNASGETEPLIIDSDSNSEGYQQLADIGTIFAIENGPTEDLFFLSFGEINGQQGVTTDPSAISVSNPLLDDVPAFGLRTFDEINASMSEVTGIPTTHESVTSVFDSVKTQLPTTELADTFLAAHQIGIAQLAITYCDALVEQEVSQAPAERRFFTAFDFNALPNTAFANAAARDTVYDPLITHTVGVSLNDQPASNAIKTNFDTLLDGYLTGDTPRNGLLDCGADCNPTRTQTIVKSLCAASIGSAMLLIQ